MPDVDTDATIWQYSMGFFDNGVNPNYALENILSFPLGYSFINSGTYSPIYHFFDMLINIFGDSSIIFFTNLQALIVYPLCLVFSYVLFSKINDNKVFNFYSSLLFTFSFYIILSARGSLAFNHFWVIPLMYIFMIRYIESKTRGDIFLFGAVTAFSFSVFPYWGVYGLLGSLVIILLKEDNFLFNIKNYVKFYFSSVSVLILLNATYVIKNFNLITQKGNAEAMRNTPEAYTELTKISSIISPLYNDSRHEWFIIHGYWIGYAILFSLIISFFIKNKKIKVLSFSVVCMIALIAHTNFTYFINLAYFELLFMFRSVARFYVVILLFSSLLSSLVFSFFLNKYPHKSFLIYALAFVLTFGTIYTNINNDSTWKHLTDYSKIKNLYKDIKNHPDIDSVVHYPFSLHGVSSMEYGTPPTYQLLAQSVHGKKIAGGADFRKSNSKKYYNSIKDIEKDTTETISNIIGYGIDSIVIHNNFFKDPVNIKNNILSDGRFEFVFTKKEDIDDFKYLSQLDISKNISFFVLKKEYKIKKTTEEKTYLYTRKEIGKSVFLDDTYNMGWHLYPKSTFSWWRAPFLKPLADRNHYMEYGYANAWNLQAEDIERLRESGDYSEASSTTGISDEASLVLYFLPQTYFYYGLVISGLTLFTIISLLLRERRRESSKR